MGRAEAQSEMSASLPEPTPTASATSATAPMASTGSDQAGGADENRGGASVEREVEEQDADVSPTGLLRSWTVTGFYTASSYGPGNARGTQIVARAAIARIGSSLLRVTLPTMLDIENGPSGFGDAQFFYLFSHRAKDAAFGIGPSLWVPTASSQSLGTGKWAFGPSAGYLRGNRRSKVVSGFLMQSFFSFAGPSWRAPMQIAALQPLLVHSLGSGWAVRSVDATWTFDLHRGSSIVPLSLGVSKLFRSGGQTFIGAFSWVTTVVHANAPRSPKNTLKFTVTIVYPPKR